MLARASSSSAAAARRAVCATAQKQQTQQVVVRRGLSAAVSHTRTVAAVGLQDPESIELPALNFEYGALEPALSGKLMEIHHAKHHNTYATNYKKALVAHNEAAAAGDTEAMLAGLPGLRFHGGGFLNHAQFWENLTPEKDFTPPEGELDAQIAKTFGDRENLQAKMSAVGAALAGSGWVWLVWDKELKSLRISQTANQDTVMNAHGANLVPLLALDVWEHAYYLDYQNVKPDYLNQVWKVINWRTVADRLAAAQAN